jgi:hypothetical protein
MLTQVEFHPSFTQAKAMIDEYSANGFELEVAASFDGTM